MKYCQSKIVLKFDILTLKVLYLVRYIFLVRKVILSTIGVMPQNTIHSEAFGLQFDPDLMVKRFLIVPGVIDKRLQFGFEVIFKGYNLTLEYSWAINIKLLTSLNTNNVNLNQLQIHLKYGY